MFSCSGALCHAFKGVLGCLLLGILLGGCEPSSPAESEYLIRLARVLDAPLSVPADFEFVPFPRRRDLLLPLAAPTLNWVEFARLHRCDMGDLAGYRNSGLGRLMDAVRRLEYEQAWLRAGQRCLEGEAMQGASATQALATERLLEELLQDKRAQLPAVFWNAVLGHPDLQRWMGVGGTAQGEEAEDLNPAGASYHLVTLRDQAQALTRLEAQPELLDQALVGLARQRPVGLAQQQWSAARSLLERATAMLEAHGDGVCRNGRPTPRAERLKNVFRKFYVAVEQPKLAATASADARWVEAFARLQDAVGIAAPQALQNWYALVLDPASATSQWQQTRQAFVAHSKAWQTLAEQCGISLFD